MIYCKEMELVSFISAFLKKSRIDIIFRKQKKCDNISTTYYFCEIIKLVGIFVD